MSGEGVFNPLDPTDILEDLTDIEADIIAIEIDIAAIEVDIAALEIAVADNHSHISIIAALVADLHMDLAQVHTHVHTIEAVTSALAVLTETGGTLTTDGNIQDIYINNAPAGVYRPVCVKIDFTAHTGTETVVLKIYYRIRAGGGLILQNEVTYAGAVSPELININLEPNRYGIEITIQKTAGTNRAYDWEVLYEV